MFAWVSGRASGRQQADSTRHDGLYGDERGRVLDGLAEDPPGCIVLGASRARQSGSCASASGRTNGSRH